MGWWKKFNIHEKGKWLLGCRKLIIYAFNYDNSLQRNQSIQRNPITTSWWSASPGRWRSTSGSIIVHIWHSNDSVTDIGPANGAASLQAELFRIEAEDNSLVEVMITLEGLTLGSDSTLKPIFFFWGGGQSFFRHHRPVYQGGVSLFQCSTLKLRFWSLLIFRHQTDLDYYHCIRTETAYRSVQHLASVHSDHHKMKVDLFIIHQTNEAACGSANVSLWLVGLCAQASPWD